MKTPMSSETKLTKDEEGECVDSNKYRCMIGSLLYLMERRSDIMFSVCQCARFQEDLKCHILKQLSVSSDTLGIFNAKTMLERLRNRRLVFASDSFGRNQWESLLCMLSTDVANKSSIYEGHPPAGSPKQVRTTLKIDKTDWSFGKWKGANNREPLSEDILGATTQRDTGSYYPKRYWELLPKEILGATTQRDTGSYYPKRYWELLPKERLGCLMGKWR
ncbi:trichome birefringence-like protein 10 [Tanacetum coccineum]